MNELIWMILVPKISIIFVSIISFLLTRYILSRKNREVLQVIDIKKVQLWWIILVLPIIYIILLFFVGFNLSLIWQFWFNLNDFLLFTGILLYILLWVTIFHQCIKAWLSTKGGWLFIAYYLGFLLIWSTIFIELIGRILWQILM